MICARSFLTVLISAALALGLLAACSSDNRDTPRNDPISGSTGERASRPFSDEVLYFLIPDRFANAADANNCGDFDGACVADDSEENVLTHGFLPADKGYYHGGDIAGLSGKLDYLEGMGVTALWVGPIFKNKPVQADITNLYGHSSAYHGYWITDFLQVDPHLGTNEEFKALVDAAHARGMHVYMDIITNHTADVIKYTDNTTAYISKDEAPYLDADGNVFDDRDHAWNGLGEDAFPALNLASFPYEPRVPDAEATVKHPAWLNDPLLYHNRGDTSFVGENALYGDFFGLDDLFTEKREVVEGMIDIYTYWIEEFGIDGYRIDTTKHVNIEFWQAFGPAIIQAARDAGIDHFFAFGEVYNDVYSPQFRALFSTEGLLQSTIDFGLQVAARDFASRSLATTELERFYDGDDRYTDADSNARMQPVFLGNHDMGRFGYFLMQDNPEASDEELLARVRLGHALMFFGRGQPVIYYGDEQGFTGDGGDKDAREDMFPSTVAVYNDNDLIGTNATTADDNFDTEHPIYTMLGDMAGVYSAHKALRDGAQIHRYASDSAGIYAFSRVTNEAAASSDTLANNSAHEYLVVLNNASAAMSATVPSFSKRGNFEQLYGDGPNTIATGDDGSVTIELPPFGISVLRADKPLDWTNTQAPNMSLSLSGSLPEPIDGRIALFERQQDGHVYHDRLEITASVDGDQLYQVQFHASINDGAMEYLGTDIDEPYRLYVNAEPFDQSDSVVFEATVVTTDGLERSVKSEPVSFLLSSPVLAGPRYNHAIIHYQRDDDNYGSSDNCWGVHVWGESVTEQSEWDSPVCFQGEDEFGRFAVMPLASTAAPVNFIVHTPSGDTVGVDREPGGDRRFDPAEHPEIWIVQDDETVHLSNPDLSTDTSQLTLHYHRPAGDYEGWGLHLWGDTTASVTWEAPLLPSRADNFGVIYEVPLASNASSLGYIIHQGDNKDPGPDQLVDFSHTAHELWQVQGADPATPYIRPTENVSTAIIHYARPGGDYDGWGLHVWGDIGEEIAASVTWENPIMPARSDTFGVVYEVPLAPGATALNYIIHKGDEKDPDADLSLAFAIDGYEVWQQQGAPAENPRVIPPRAND